uniref:Putative LRR receptor-like serine/threonine-protein kinase n=1 Tax=Aegilops tauschii TaxID=37682 RepID=M8C8M2_AEGTA
MAINGKLWSKAPFTPQHLVCDAFFNSEAHRGFGGHYNVTLTATANSTLLPTINAAEFFSVVSTANVATDAKDVAAMAAIKAKYEVKKNWAGDPCTPKTLVWEGLNCSYAISMPPRITRLNMSFGGLSGRIPSHFGNLKAIKYLDLSYNNFTGPIPNALSDLPFLVVLDLTGNQLNGSIPAGLLKRIQDGSLTLRYGKNPNLCSNGSSCEPAEKKGKSMLAVYIVVPILAIVVIGALAVLLLLIIRRKQGSRKGSVKPQNEASGVHSQSRNGDTHSMLQLDNRRFTYKDLQIVTNNFKTVLGRGGFGSVYGGFLADGTQVAVKLRSESSSQGVREFLTEAQTLTKIHHKNLVSMVGYCKDGEYMALVYEHMSEGNLEDKLRGLEYLHVACSPAFVHRDVKTSNILLNVYLEAKVADFGLLKAFNQDVITGRPPILQCPEPTNIIQWVRQHLAQGNIEDVADVHIRGDYDINSVWKVADVALKCTAQAPTQRPTMSEVVGQLQECLKLEEQHMI